MRRLVLALTGLSALLLGLPSLPSASAADPLRVGVGRADITSPTGYYMQGWVRSDAVLRGVHTRIEARAIVLERGGRKLALVAEDLNGISGGVVKAAALRLAPLGFSEANLLVSASHTHAAPSGYYAYGTYNTVFMTKNDLTHQNVTGQLDPQLYAFEVRQLVLAVTRADRDLAPGKLGWATTRLLGVTANRSIEAHLADRGIHKAYGTGSVADDPLGYADTIDPDVQVLRVDRLTAGRYRSVGMWSTFADHGTVNKYTFGVYNADHHGAATRVVEQAVREQSGTPSGQDVVNAYGNTDEGDQSAGLTRDGPAAADAVGRLEAAAMLAAWRAAGHHLTETPPLDLRWTRVCLCGHPTHDGPVATQAATGLPLFTGSEEGRGGLYDLTGIPFEGRSSPVDDPVDPAQGHKLVVTRATPGSIPTTVPLLVARIGPRLVASLPGEMTVEMGRRVRSALAAAVAGSGIDAVQLSGLAGEYLSYFTTPEEYDAQHYEGGSTMYGRTSSVFLQEQLVALARTLVSRSPAPTPDATDPRNGVVDTAPPFGSGVAGATALAQPGPTQRLARAAFAWSGATLGLDMPLGRAFVSAERRTAAGWRHADDDQGLDFLWRVDANGRYDAEWEVPRDQPLGTYRIVVTANHYRLVSSPFPVLASTALSVERLGNQAVIRYPDPVVDVDLTARPLRADGGRLVRGSVADVPAGGAVDRYGNCNGAAVQLQPGQRGGAEPGADPSVCRGR